MTDDLWSEGTDLGSEEREEPKELGKRLVTEVLLIWKEYPNFLWLAPSRLYYHVMLAASLKLSMQSDRSDNKDV